MQMATLHLRCMPSARGLTNMKTRLIDNIRAAPIDGQRGRRYWRVEQHARRRSVWYSTPGTCSVVSLAPKSLTG
jgi:hypothetical protein